MGGASSIIQNGECGNFDLVATLSSDHVVWEKGVILKAHACSQEASPT